MLPCEHKRGSRNSRPWKAEKLAKLFPSICMSLSPYIPNACPGLAPRILPTPSFFGYRAPTLPRSSGSASWSCRCPGGRWTNALAKYMVAEVARLPHKQCAQLQFRSHEVCLSRAPVYKPTRPSLKEWSLEHMARTEAQGRYCCCFLCGVVLCCLLSAGEGGATVPVRLRVCMYVCLYVCTYVYVCVCICICKHIRSCMYMRMCLCMCMHMYM